MRTSRAGCGFEGVDDCAVVVALVADELEESGEGHVVFAEEWTVAGAAIHEVGVHLAAEFCARFDDEAREPGDAIDLGAFGGEFAHFDDAAGRLSVHDFEEILASNRGDGEDGFEIHVVIVEGVVHEVEQLLRRAADGGEEGGIGGLEHGASGLAPGFPCGDCAVPHVSKFGFPVFLIHDAGTIPRDRAGAMFSADF